MVVCAFSYNHARDRPLPNPEHRECYYSKSNELSIELLKHLIERVGNCRYNLIDENSRLRTAGEGLPHLPLAQGPGFVAFKFCRNRPAFERGGKNLKLNNYLFPRLVTESVRGEHRASGAIQSLCQ